MKKNPKEQHPDTPGTPDKDLPGYPIYPANEDIYQVEKKEAFDETGISGLKKKPDLDRDLDIPGAELDDANESIGEEDEENNYYSLGGDAHTDLDEN